MVVRRSVQIAIHVRWVPCDDGMARPHTARGGQLRGSGLPKRAGPPALELDLGLMYRYLSRTVCYEMLHLGRDFDGFFGTA